MSETLAYRTRDDDYRPSHDEDDEEEEDVDESGYKTVKDALLFAIQVTPSMLKEPPADGAKKNDRSCPLIAALKCTYHLMQQRIISNPKDMMGILLFGTEETKYSDEDETSTGGWSFPHCYLLTDLDVPEAEDVKALRRLAEDSSDAVKKLFKPSKEPVAMHNVLFCANQIFQKKAANFSSRRLFIVTDDDNPHADDKAYASRAAVRAKDLYDLGVMIELFPISSPEHAFDTTLFYDDIVYRSTPSDPDAISYNPSSLTDADGSKLQAGSRDGISLLQSLLSNIASKAAPRRTLFSSVPFELAPGFRISVKGYLLYKRQKPARSCYIYLGSERPQIVKGSTTRLADDTARPVEKVEIRKAYSFGGEHVSFTPDEMKQLRNFGDPIIRLVGFKPQSLLPTWANIKQSTFLYPSEDDYVGSTRVFSALHHKLVNDKLMALTWFIPRRTAAPVIAALVPTLSAGDTDTASSNVSGISATGCPQGLHLIPLPFADDVRQNPPMLYGDSPLRAPDELVDAMRPIIQQLNLPKGIYDPAKYPNPSLQWHYRILQAIALDEDLPEKPEDKTRPKYRQIDTRIGNEALEWKETLERVYRAQMKSGSGAGIGSKRSAAATAANGEGSGSKKIKTELGQILGEDEVRKLWQKGQLGSLTVAQLRDFAMIKKIPMGGRKAELTERIEEWFEGR